MDRRYWGRRTVSLVLALELLLSPVAMARAADPAHILAVPEVPLGDEVQVGSLPGEEPTQADRVQAKLLEGDPLAFNKVLITTNLSLLTETSIEFDEENWVDIYSYFFRLNSADDLLNVEVTSEEEPLMGSFWASQQFPLAKGTGERPGEDSRYTYLPALLDARVPDMKSDGYYLVTTDEHGNVEEGVRPLGQDGQETFLTEAPEDAWWEEEDMASYFDGQPVKLQSSYQTVVGDALNEFNENYLPLAAWFVPSDEAMLTAFGMTARGTVVKETDITRVYTQDPLVEATPAVMDITDFTATPEGNKAGTEFGAEEMWIQVGSDQTSLDLHFQTYEPYYSYTRDGEPQEGAACPVSVTYSLDGGANRPMELTRGDNLTCQFLPRPERFDSWDRGANTQENKARGDWRVTGIPLTDEENDSPKEVVVTLTVTAPDGSTKRTYTLHVQRRQSTAGKSVLDWGNTPYGMIERDDADKWSGEITKVMSKARFLTNGLRFSDVATRPTGPVNQNGGIYHRWPYTNCWPSGEDNPDLDPTAIVAYQDMRFQDPGVTFTDSFGREVDLENALYSGTVKRTIRLQTPRSGVLSASSWTLSDALTNTCWYNVTADGTPTLTTDADQAAQTLTSLDQEVDLRGLVVLPGIYEIVYSYTDPCADDTTPEKGPKPTYTDTVTRTLVVLPIPGDVDMDGAVTSADAYAMKNNLKDWQEGTSDRIRLAVGRVFDLNGNGTLEAEDYQAILNGYQPELLRSGPVSDYFYIPLPAGDAGYQRKTWDQVENTGSGTLTLEFMGVEQGTRNGEYTVDPQGPFSTKTEEDGSLTPVALKDQETGVDNSIFWMGVKLEDSPLNGDYIENFTLSLTYDSRYVEPAQVYTASDKSSYEAQAGSGSFEGWSYTLRKYNLRNDTADSRVLWKGTLSAYDASGSAAARSYQTHYSKVVGELEQGRGTSTLRELVVTLRYQGGGAAHARVGDGYLLAIPFKLKAQPPKDLSSEARLIELGAGMRELTLVTTRPQTSLLASLFGVGRAAGEETTSAFSAQEEIYGGSTQNLRDGLRYDTDSGLVPIGKDNTARTVLATGTYGEAYRVNSVGQGNAVGVVKDFPPGLVYNAGAHSITGTPLVPGTYQFELNEILYEITIKPKTIHYRAKNADSYYGEPEYRGTVADREKNPDLRNFEFEYNAKDLSDGDRTYAKDVLGIKLGDGSKDEWRSGTELADILNRTVTNPYNDKKDYTYLYTAPGFTATRNTAGDPVESGSAVGDYTIHTTMPASSTCYTLEQERTASLTVVRRPVYVDHIIASAEDSGLAIYNDERVSFTGRVLYDKGTSTQIVLTLPMLEADGTYNSRPLTGSAKVGSDRVAVTYNGQFLHDLTKGDTNTTFQLNSQQEERQVEAQRVTLRDQVSGNGSSVQLQSGNYTLADASVRHREGSDDIKGIVILRGVAEMQMTDFPSELGRANYYGARIENPEALMVRAVLGEGSSSTLVGKYAYNSPDLFPLLIHYNWVTPEEYEAGTAPGEETSLVGTGVDAATGKDTRPYGFSREEDPDERREGGYRDNYLYPDMNGWRICACVSQYVGDQEGNGEGQYIKCYSEPITVLPRTLTVTAKGAQRFYGEELGEGLPDFTFRTSQLAAKDTQGVVRGTSAELKMVFDRLDVELEGYGIAERHKLPEFKMVDDQGNEVTATTPIVAGRTYKIVIFGGESPCYDIQYTVQDGEETSTSPVEGSAPLIIQPRPIIVKAIRGNGENDSFTNIYADTKNLVVNKDPQSGSLLEAGEGKVDFMLPQYDPVRGTTSYYTATSDGNMYTDYSCTFPAGTDRDTEALVEGDDVRVRYQVRFLPDQGCYTWSEFTQGFFDNEAIAESGNGYLDKQVQVERMELVGEDSGNYVMVFADDVSFMDRVPSSAMDNTVSAPANNDQAMNKPYYVSGQGRVYLRPIQNIVITSLGQMRYTYGDQFAPSEPGTAGKSMTVRVEYDRTYDNDPGNNFNTEEVEYRQLRVDELGNRISTFAARGFTIYYVKPGQTRSDAETLDQRVTSGDIMTPGIHNGATLFVTGRRSVSDPLVYSEYAPGQEEEPIRVDKATLTLSAVPAHKFYGEENPTGDYTFTMDTRELVEVDQKALRALNGGTLAREGTQEDLAKLDHTADFTGLRFSTAATVRSPVGTNGKWGEYDLTLTAADPTAVLANYNVTTRDAHLYVYPRPVRVTGINSSASDPVYTIFNDPSTFTYRTEFSTAQRESGLLPRVEVSGTRVPIYPVNAGNSGDGKQHDLPITTGLGLVNGDDLIFRARVDFPNDGWSLTGADVSLGVEVSELTLVNTATTRNYTLLTTAGESFGELGQTTIAKPVWGSAKLRTIKSITITNPPNKLEYTYGEPLDLTGLRVWVEYAQLDQETGSVEQITVDYLGPEQFKSMGLYVNYWTPGEPLPTGNVQRRDLPDVYWTAATGDHVTIAPTHETQRYLTNPGSVPKAHPFAANGKYLVVSGFQKAVAGNPTTQIAAAPVILGERTASGQYVGTPTPIKVNPLKLRYTLRAEDKTYDGDRKAAGSLTLTNLYGAGTDADVAYVPMGAAYEDSSMDHSYSKFAEFKRNVVDGRVTFSTGTYTPNGEAPLMENGRTLWADGYLWGRGLTFTFPNPNVHYVDDSGVSRVGTGEQADYWRASQSYEDVTKGWDSYKAVTAMPVEVTNMVLAGPDAANYTWDWDSSWTWDAGNSHRVAETAVLMTTRSATVDGQAAAPFATIQKANRAPIQELDGYSGGLARLVVDRTTNVVRLLLDQALSALADNNNAAGTEDDFRDELHFEYALLYAQTGEDGQPTGLLARWAGADGGKAYQDTTFFGGEAVKPNPTAEGFKPDVTRLPKPDSKNENTIYKGQVYQWADLDTGLVEVGGRTFREDSGFVLDPSAYPGGAILTDRDGNEIKAEDAYWNYTLYTTDRVNLPRDTVFYPLVRLAETHNYHASGNLSGDAAVSAALLDAAQKALAAWEADGTEENLAAAKEASQNVFNAARGMEEAAKAASQAQMDADAAQAENSQWPDEQPAPQIGPAAAVKTLTQRLDLTSASTERSQDSTDTTDYLVELLEAVWFTDTLIYGDEKHLSAVVYNHPTRYYGYFWDADKTAKVEFNETALNFTEEIVVPVRLKLEDGSTVETTITVNLFDQTVGGRVAKVYVQTSNETGRKVRRIQILPTVLYARLGDAPYQLSWVTEPERPSNRRYRWTSSDSAVASVDENGLVTFRGVGSCTITVSTDNGKSSSITVTVSEVLPLDQGPDSLFNLLQNRAWMELDEEDNFYPELPMTRAQAVEVLDLFTNPDAKWAATTELPYLDVSGEEKYAGALRRMNEAGVVVGLPGSAFGGDRLISRAEFVTMVVRMLRLDTPDTKGQVHQFLDAGEEDTWAYRYIDALGKTSVIRGTGGGSFAPERVLTREEAAAILARLLTVKLDVNTPGLKTPADMTPANWSYEYVLQAINTIVFPEPAVTPPTED